MVTAVLSSKSYQASVAEAMIRTCHSKMHLPALLTSIVLHNYTRSVIRSKFSTLGEKDLLPEIQPPQSPAVDSVWSNSPT